MFKAQSGGQEGSDLNSDVQFIQKQLSYLEQSSEERSKVLLLGQAPLKKEIAKLQQDLREERAMREKVI
jgi:hypothetical protein